MARLHKKYIRALVAFLAVTAFAVVTQIVVSGTVLHPDRLAVWVFDVGQGDAIFIDAPDAQILIDGGPDARVVEKLTRVMPFWDRSIDLVINTHPHADHVSGLVHVLRRYDVGEVWVSGQSYRTGVYEAFSQELDAELVQAGESMPLGGGGTLRVLWPRKSLEGEFLDDPNAGSIVTRLRYGKTDILLAGDIGVEQEEQIQSAVGDIDVLKVAHRGSITSSSPTFLASVRPEVAIIPVGENDYGHPHGIVLDRLRDIESTILRTDRHGDIRILSDGGEPDISLFDL